MGGGGGSRFSNYFVIILRERDSEPPWQACTWLCTMALFFVRIFTCFENN